MIYLGFDVPRKINQAVNAGNISKVYGKENNNIIRKPLESANIRQENLNTKNPAVSVDNPAPVQKVQNVQPTVSKPVISRKRVQGNGINLVRGQKWSITGTNAVKIGIGWDCENSECELDVSAFMLAQNGKVPDESWFVFYGQDRSPDKSVSYKSNIENSYSPDDAEMTVLLDSVSSNINKITICVTMYEALQKRIDFSVVKNFYIRIMNVNGTELARYQTDNLSSDITSLVAGEIYRYNNEWKFCAIGKGFRKDLAEFCNIYGVEIE